MSDLTSQLQFLSDGFRLLREQELNLCINPDRPDLKATPMQLEILQDEKTQFIYVLGGNRCLAAGTAIATPQGPVAIEQLRPGDYVYDEHGQPIRVKAAFANGPKEVVELHNRKKVWATCTTDHVWLARDGSHPERNYPAEELAVKDFYKKCTQGKRQTFSAPLGNAHEPHAYAIGALLGDGCSKQGSKNLLYISSADELVPSKVASILGCDFMKCGGENYTWKLVTNTCNHYDNWCRGRYAHEKTVSPEVIRSWDRASLLAFVAGVIDTDGSLYINEYNNLCIRTEMQAYPVLKALEYAFLALWQTPINWHISNREKYVNGPTYTVGVMSNAFSKRILKELDPHLVTPSKKWKPEYEEFVALRSSEEWVSLKPSTHKTVVETYDIHVDSPTNLYCLANGLVTHNSGKSALGSRVVSWFFNNNHPYMQRPPEWGNGPLTIMVIGRVGSQVEYELFEKKLKPFLKPDSYKLDIRGGILQRAVHKENGNQILFFSHHNINEAREKVQAFTAHVIWLDEMADSASFIAELQTRLVTTRGKLLCTFTPLVRSEEVRRMVDGATAPTAKKYNLLMLDNPLLQDPIRRQEVLDSFKDLSEAERNTRLNGAWYTGDLAVYDFSSARHCSFPDGYSSGWRHVASVDPAMAGKTGYTLWAEHPDTGVWYCTDACYLQNILDPTELVQKVEARHRYKNVVRRVSDPHEAWYIATAATMGYHYISPYRKNERKQELIKNLQTALSDGRLKVAPHCVELIDEFLSCQWAEDAATPRIIGASRYHHCDTAQYFWDCKPKFVPHQAPLTLLGMETQLRIENKKRRRAEDKKRATRFKRRRA